MFSPLPENGSFAPPERVWSFRTATNDVTRAWVSIDGAHRKSVRRRQPKRRVGEPAVSVVTGPRTDDVNLHKEIYTEINSVSTVTRCNDFPGNTRYARGRGTRNRGCCIIQTTRTIGNVRYLCATQTLVYFFKYPTFSRPKIVRKVLEHTPIRTSED